MAAATFEQVQRLVDQLSPLDQVRLMESLTARIGQVLVSLHRASEISKEPSQGKAAEIAGLSRVQFIDTLDASGISANQTLEEVDEEVKLPRSRHREHEWRRLNRGVLTRFEGQWVVLDGEEIVVHGEDPIRLVEQAREKGIEDPYVFRVEKTQPNIVKIGL